MAPDQSYAGIQQVSNLFSFCKDVAVMMSNIELLLVSCCEDYLFMGAGEIFRFLIDILFLDCFFSALHAD